MIEITADLVERLAAIAWKASQDAAFDSWYESDEKRLPFPVKWQDRTDKEREITRAGIRTLLADLTSAGRLVPEGGQILDGLIDCQEGYILTAEQFAAVQVLHNDVRLALEFGEFRRLQVREARRKLDALFPATESAAQCACPTVRSAGHTRICNRTLPHSVPHEWERIQDVPVDQIVISSNGRRWKHDGRTVYLHIHELMMVDSQWLAHSYKVANGYGPFVAAEANS